MDYMKYFFDIYSQENIRLKRQIVGDIIKNLLISRQVVDIDTFNIMAGSLRRASQISSKEIFDIYCKIANDYKIDNDVTEFYQKNNKDILEKSVLTWKQVQKLFHNKIIKAKIIHYHVNGKFKVADELIVLGIIKNTNDVERAKCFCGKNEVIAYTMESELKF
ncbi:MAG TPA: hypothetical protein DG753_05790 [Clostridium sp.]|nr:hypothetical protein [Clostridium sp.]